MGRNRHCTICTSDPAITGQVNAQIEAGCKQKLIHEQTPQFSVSQISRHTRNCLTPKPDYEQAMKAIAKLADPPNGFKDLTIDDAVKRLTQILDIAEGGGR